VCRKFKSVLVLSVMFLLSQDLQASGPESSSVGASLAPLECKVLLHQMLIGSGQYNHPNPILLIEAEDVRLRTEVINDKTYLVVWDKVTEEDRWTNFPAKFLLSSERVDREVEYNIYDTFPAGIDSMALSPDRKWLAISHHYTARRAAPLEAPLAGHRGTDVLILDVEELLDRARNTQGRGISSPEHIKSIRISTANTKWLQTPRGFSKMVFSPDGKYLAAISFESFEVFRISEDGTPLRLDKGAILEGKDKHPHDLEFGRKK
jgi:hypothetical protein